MQSVCEFRVAEGVGGAVRCRAGDAGVGAISGTEFRCVGGF